MRHLKYAGKLFHPVTLITLAVLGVLVYFAVTTNGFGLANVNLGGGTTVRTDVQACPQDPTLNPVFASQLQQGTSLSPTFSAKVNGGVPQAITSSTKFANGDKVQIKVNQSGYISKLLPEYTVGCGVNTINGQLLSLTAVPTLKVIGSAGTVLGVAQNWQNMTGANANESSATTSITNTLRITPGLYMGTGDMIIVIDSNSSAKVTSITSSGLSLYERGTPNIYRPTNTANRVVAFRVPNTNSQKDITYTLNPTSGATIQGWVNITVYSAQAYTDVDGTFKDSGIEDTDGNWKGQNMTSTAYLIV